MSDGSRSWPAGTRASVASGGRCLTSCTATRSRRPGLNGGRWRCNARTTASTTVARQMFEHLPVLLRSAMYVLRGGFLIRPLVIAVALGIAGAVFSSLEESRPEIGAWIPSVLFPSRQDPAVAQVILSSIATSIMTVVSIVFAILLMTLTLASTQFSPRILIGFTRDRTTQWTLGVFLGTFSYCIATLPARARCRIRSCRSRASRARCCWRWSVSAGSSTSSITSHSRLASTTLSIGWRAKPNW